MLFYCGYTWQPKTTAEQVRARMKQQHEAGTNHPERFKGYYGLAGAAPALASASTPVPLGGEGDQVQRSDPNDEYVTPLLSSSPRPSDAPY